MSRKRSLPPCTCAWLPKADASPGQVQFIIADNQLPPAYRRDYDEIDFTYQSPTVSTIRDPTPLTG